MNASQPTTSLFFIGRLLVGGMYLGAGIDNFAHLPAKIGYTASKGVIAPDVLVPLASALLLIAGLSFVTGLRPRTGILAIAVFFIPVTLLMHNFWAYDGMQRLAEMHAFMGNIGLLGAALVFLGVPQPWPLSLTSAMAARRFKRQPGQAGRAGADVDPATKAGVV